MDDSGLIQAREHARIESARYAKRKYDTWCSCKKCKKLSLMSDKTISFICRYCSSHNTVDESHARYEAGDFVEEESKARPDLGANVKSGENREYSNLRDEHEIRADMFAKGKTRESMGWQKFNRELKKELKHEKCYRGEQATGV